MSTLDQDLAERLCAWEARGLRRELRRIDSPQGTHITLDTRKLLNFSSNDYLGLANDPRIKEAATKALERYGAGSGASRLISGSLAIHTQLEEALAQFKRAEAALTFSSGYAAALGTIGALLGKGDVIIVDKLVHASLVDATRLCGAKLRVFRHNDLNDLEDILKWADGLAGDGQVSPRPRVLVVTESLFSMDGDRAPLREMVELKDRYGAWLMVDEAHATGVFGATRRGLAEEARVADRIEVQMGTLGKALGSAGGYICGSRTLVDFLINSARSFVFSTAPVPAAAAAARAAVKFVASPFGSKRCARLWSNMRAFSPDATGPIIPVMVGDEAEAMALAQRLRESGFFVPAIRYPTVARGKARLRVTLCAAHELEDIEALCRVLVMERNSLDSGRRAVWQP